GRGGRRLCQAAVPAAGPPGRVGRGRSPPQGRRLVVGARAEGAGPAWAGADVRQRAAVAGQAGRAAGRLAAGRVRAVRGEGGQDGQVVRGDGAAGRGRDPRGDRAGGRRLGGVLLHSGGGDRPGSAGGGGRPRRPGADVQGRQGGLGCGRAAGAQRPQQRGVLQPEPVAVHAGRGVGLGQGGRG